MMHVCKPYAFFLLLFQLSCARPSIEQVRDSIIKNLSKNNPMVVIEFNNFYNQFDRVIRLFFDKKNNQSLALHIKQIELIVKTLKGISIDQNFQCVRVVLQEYYAEVKDLLAILKEYVGSINSVSFALRVKRFEFIVPTDIRKRGQLYIFGSLHHRLMC